MGHAMHFLSRLSRVEGDHRARALALYRDRALLDRVLARVSRLPETISRIAIALEDTRHGPFVIVTRSGEFITCLAQGMHCSQHPIVAFEIGGATHAAGAGRHERRREEPCICGGSRSFRRCCASRLQHVA